MIQTLGQARDSGMKITARCAWGRREGRKSIRQCTASIRLDLESLIWMRGAAFPISMLEGRLKCPRCGSRRASSRKTEPASPVQEPLPDSMDLSESSDTAAAVGKAAPREGSKLASGHCHVWTAPADQGLFLALRRSLVRSCLRPFARRIESAGPDVVR
jgi:hypothetical protein